MSEIEYFYAAHSAFAYLGSARLIEIAKAAGRRIVHRPFDLRRGLAHTGAPSFAARTKAHKAYYFGREIARWSEYRAAPVVGHRPLHQRHPASPHNGQADSGIYFAKVCFAGAVGTVNKVVSVIGLRRVVTVPLRVRVIVSPCGTLKGRQF